MTAEAIRLLQIENARLRDENRRLSEKLQRLQRALGALVLMQEDAARVSASTDPFQVIENILTIALQAMDSENGSLLLLDEESGELVFVAVQGPARERLMGVRLPAGAGIAGQALAQNQPIVAGDVRTNPYWYGGIDALTGIETHSLISVPVVSETGPLGVLEVVNTHSGELFTEDDQNILRLVAWLAGMILARAEQAA